MSTVKTSSIEALAGGGPPDNLLPITCSAWVNFNGTGTVAIRDGYNVSSITDVSAGRYQVNFSSAMSDSNYSVSLGGISGLTSGNLGLGIIGISTTDVEVRFVSNAVAIDTDKVCVQIFGGQ